MWYESYFILNVILFVINKMADVVENLLFSILVIGNLKDHIGNTWRREIQHMYVIEITFLDNSTATYHLLKLFPSVFCVGPKDVQVHCGKSDDKCKVLYIFY